MSLIGCYSTDLVVTKQMLPVVLPKLCAQVHVVTPIENPFVALTLRAYLNDELIAELELKGIDQVNAPTPSIEGGTPPRWAMVGAFMTFSPFALSEKNGSLRIDAETETGLIRGMGLRLVVRDPPSAAAPQA